MITSMNTIESNLCVSHSIIIARYDTRIWMRSLYIDVSCFVRFSCASCHTVTLKHTVRVYKKRHKSLNELARPRSVLQPKSVLIWESFHLSGAKGVKVMSATTLVLNNLFSLLRNSSERYDWHKPFAYTERNLFGCVHQPVLWKCKWATKQRSKEQERIQLFAASCFDLNQPQVARLIRLIFVVVALHVFLIAFFSIFFFSFACAYFDISGFVLAFMLKGFHVASIKLMICASPYTHTRKNPSAQVESQQDSTLQIKSVLLSRGFFWLRSVGLYKTKRISW